MPYNLRPIHNADLDLICLHREHMFLEAGRDRGLLQKVTASFKPWLVRRLETGEYFGWIMEHGGAPVAGLGMMVIDWPPHPAHPDEGHRGYILNVYVDPEHRGRGLATQLMDRAKEEARERGIHYMILHATDQGRPLYEKLGWQATSEMAFLTGE